MNYLVKPANNAVVTDLCWYTCYNNCGSQCGGYCATFCSTACSGNTCMFADAVALTK